jgi:Copper transport outer membrane protein, MctB
VISFRYHVVTIVAVFLALAIGLLAGSAFVEPELTDELRRQTEDLRRQTDDLRSQLAEARIERDAAAAFVEAVAPSLTQGRLAGTPVVVVTQTGVEDAVLAQTQEALVNAGANVVTTISATEQIVSEDPETQEELAIMLGEPTAPAEDLSSLTAEALAERLSAPRSPLAEQDVLASLLSAGFLAPVDGGPSESTLEDIGAPGQVVVVLSGGRGDGDPVLPPAAFAVPLVESLAGLDVPVAAGESLLNDYDYVSLVRASDLDGAVTVDDLDRTIGGTALVLGVEDLLATGAGGDYGVKDGAEPLPPLP